jgi:hypothetical protein
MILEKLNGMTILYAEGDNKITNKNRSLFVNVIYLGKGDSEDNYEEVPYDIWRNYLTDITPSNEAEKINEKIETLKEETIRLKNENALLIELLLENDYRLSQEMSLLKQSNKVE